MKSQKKGSFGQRLKQIDLYGEPVGVNHEGQSTFRTGFGGIMTIFIFSLLLSYSTIKVKKLLLHEQPD